MLPTKVLILFVAIQTVNCGNILFLHGLASPSHHLWSRVLIKGLTERGHNITMVSVDADIKPEPNVHYIHLEAVYQTIYEEQESTNLLLMADQKNFEAIKGVYDWCEYCCDGILNSKGLDIILNYPNNFKFDAVIYDFTCSPCLLPLIHKFNYPPLISVSAFNNPPYTKHLTGGQKYPAFVPHYITNYPKIMSFPQRFINSLLYAADSLYRQYVMLPNIEKKIRERFNFKDFPSLSELEKNTSVLLINSDNSIEIPEPLEPNVIQVSGLQIQELKELPEDLLTFIESSKRGTVLMSLGTNVKSNMLKKETLTSILQTFAELPEYNFIWKFESEPKDLPLIPSKNVLISKFLPQKEILANPKVKAFVTHSGLLSTQEAMWYGKPIIAVPFFLDQDRTAGKSVQMGIGVKIDFRTLNVVDFKNAIRTVVENPTFMEKAKEISKLFQDKPMKPLDTAIWWIEYAIRNPKAPQFYSTSLSLGSFAANSYDVILACILLLSASIFLIYRCTKVIKKNLLKSDSIKLKRN